MNCIKCEQILTNCLQQLDGLCAIHFHAKLQKYISLGYTPIINTCPTCRNCCFEDIPIGDCDDCQENKRIQEEEKDDDEYYDQDWINPYDY